MIERIKKIWEEMKRDLGESWTSRGIIDLEEEES